jgi:hypothetical protein
VLQQRTSCAGRVKHTTILRTTCGSAFTHAHPQVYAHFEVGIPSRRPCVRPCGHADETACYDRVSAGLSRSCRPAARTPRRTCWGSAAAAHTQPTDDQNFSAVCSPTDYYSAVSRYTESPKRKSELNMRGGLCYHQGTGGL